jgi:hypothetical protein
VGGLDLGYDVLEVGPAKPELRAQGSQHTDSPGSPHRASRGVDVPSRSSRVLKFSYRFTWVQNSCGQRAAVRLGHPASSVPGLLRVVRRSARSRVSFAPTIDEAAFLGVKR